MHKRKRKNAVEKLAALEKNAKNLRSRFFGNVIVQKELIGSPAVVDLQAKARTKK